MRTHSNNRSGLGKVLDRGNRRTDTRIIRDGFAIERDVEVTADEDPFAL